MCGNAPPGSHYFRSLPLLKEQDVSPFFSTVCALFAQNCRGVPPLFLLRRLGANLELAAVLYPERLPRGVPRAATHLLTSQQLPPSLPKQPGCTSERARPASHSARPTAQNPLHCHLRAELGNIHGQQCVDSGGWTNRGKGV